MSEGWRRRPDLNRGWRFCRPLPYHLATAPVGRKKLDYRGSPAASMRRNNSGEKSSSSTSMQPVRLRAKVGLPTEARSRTRTGPPSRFALRWATFACIHGAKGLPTEARPRTAHLRASRYGGQPSPAFMSEGLTNRSSSTDGPPSRFALRWATFACIHERRLERETGFEPATSTLARSHSTTELFPPTSTRQPHGDRRTAVPEELIVPQPVSRHQEAGPSNAFGYTVMTSNGPPMPSIATTSNRHGPHARPVLAR